MNRMTFAAVTLGLMLSAGQLIAQTTYQYTGQPFTQFSCGPSPSGNGTLLCSTPGPNATTSYTTTDHVTATLRFDYPLAANLNLADVHTLAGFQLSMSDGHQTVTTTNGPVGLIALVSTDAGGQISAWRLIINLGNAANSGIATQNWFNSQTSSFVVTDSATLACCDPTVSGDLARNTNSAGTWGSGAATPAQKVSDLLTIVQGMSIPKQGTSLTDKLQIILNDINSQNGLACADLTGFTNQVNAQTAKSITTTQASQLLSAAAEISNGLHCGS